MEVTFLGTAAVVPGGGHDTASLLVNGNVLVDVGWCAVLRMRQFGYDPMDLEWLLLTHGHHDHYLGLPHLLFYLCMKAKDRPDRPPLKIAGPAEDVERVVRLARGFLQPKRFAAVVYEPELYPLGPGDALDTGNLRVETCRALHPVAALAFRFTEADSPASVVYTGDTGPSDDLAVFAGGAALLIHEASYGPDPAPAENPWGHSGAPDAARTAAAAAAGRLALVHCPEERQLDALAAARALFPNTYWPADGETVSLS